MRMRFASLASVIAAAALAPAGAVTAAPAPAPVDPTRRESYRGSRRYVRREPVTTIDHARVARAEAKRQRRAIQRAQHAD